MRDTLLTFTPRWCTNLTVRGIFPLTNPITEASMSVITRNSAPARDLSVRQQGDPVRPPLKLANLQGRAVQMSPKQSAETNAKVSRHIDALQKLEDVRATKAVKQAEVDRLEVEITEGLEKISIAREKIAQADNNIKNADERMNAAKARCQAAEATKAAAQMRIDQGKKKLEQINAELAEDEVKKAKLRAKIEAQDAHTINILETRVIQPLINWSQQVPAGQLANEIKVLLAKCQKLKNDIPQLRGEEQAQIMTELRGPFNTIKAAVAALKPAQTK